MWGSPICALCPNPIIHNRMTSKWAMPALLGAVFGINRMHVCFFQRMQEIDSVGGCGCTTAPGDGWDFSPSAPLSLVCNTDFGVTHCPSWPLALHQRKAEEAKRTPCGIQSSYSCRAFPGDVQPHHLTPSTTPALKGNVLSWLIWKYFKNFA